MTASGEANMDIRDAMLTPPMNSCRAGWSRKAMLACATSANTKTSSTRIPMIFSCGEDEEHTGIINHPGKHRLLQKWREREKRTACRDRIVRSVLLVSASQTRQKNEHNSPGLFSEPSQEAGAFQDGKSRQGQGKGITRVLLLSA